ncbi:hypothetical protein Tco_0676670 [Tanacetum coccineum]
MAPICRDALASPWGFPKTKLRRANKQKGVPIESTVRVLYMYCETWALGLYLVFLSGIREPRGFGFVQFLEENRKKPTDMRTRERRGGSGRFNDRRRSPPRYSRSPPPRYSWSPPPRYAQSRSNSREYSPPPKRKQHVRSVSPGEKRHSRERSYSRSPPPARGRSPPPRSPVTLQQVKESKPTASKGT